MKRLITYVLAGVLVLLGGASCTSENAYSTQLKKEKKQIEEYIKRNNIVIIHDEPAYDKWKENEYLELDDYCYFHLTVMGDTTKDEIVLGDDVLLRYRRYTLTEPADTLSYWTSNDASYPIEFQYYVTSAAACMGWHYALSVMKYTGAEGKLICPSKLGFDADASSVTPYGYDMKIKIKTF
ncbi:MAG: DUF4827 family protein [Paludibacteraceae bacterium]|jgi:hypothetical protein|nr:DUF4827 family protein [Paludibacteraceae bacterium]